MSEYEISMEKSESESESEIPMEKSDQSEISMEKEIDFGIQLSTGRQEHASRSKSLCIYKVEQNLKKVHEESTFHPKLVSIGPFHHNKSEHLKLMEQHKWRSLSDYLKSMKLTSTAGATTTDDDDDDTIIMTKKRRCLVAAMEKLEANARACYSEMPKYDDLGSNEFRMMMLLDGCFIIQLLLLFKKSVHSCRNADDPMYTWRSTLAYLRHDLLLLENQLPFIVLHELLEMSGINKEVYKLTDLILDFFNPVLYREKMVLDDCKKLLVFSNHNHLLEFFMSSFQTTKTIHQEDQLALQVQDEDQHVVQVHQEDQHVVQEDYQEDQEVQRTAYGYFPRQIAYGYFPEDIPNDTGYFPEDILNDTGDRDQVCGKIHSYVSEDIPNDMSMGDFFQEVIPNYSTGHHAQDMSIHCVTELREAGIEFKKRDHHDILDIEFKEGKLHIPTLFIDDNTVPVLLNFIAFEQRHHSIKPYFTSYLMFLDYLVNSSKDVEHLHYKGIINHGLGSDEEVATLFNKLCKEVVLDLGDDNYLSKVFAEVNLYFGKRRNRWRAAWKHEYFRTPWAFSSFLAAIVLLVLTFLQTYFSMYAYFRPPSN